MKYKAAASGQRIAIGQDIIGQFVVVGSEMEVNLSSDTRKQIITITNLIKKMKDNKDKYQQLLMSSRHQGHNKEESLINEQDIQYMKHKQHHRIATTKQMPLQLLAITSETNEDIQDVVYSMGFTETLFDKAYDEVFGLMANNWWLSFRNKILEYCGDEEFVKMQREKIKLKKEAVATDQHIIKIINSLRRSQKKHAQAMNNNKENKENNAKRGGGQHFRQNGRTKIIIKKRKHQRKRSKDDLDLSFKPRNLTSLDVLSKHNIIMDFTSNHHNAQNFALTPVSTSRRFDANELTEEGSVIIHPSNHNTPIVLEDDLKDDEIIEMDTEDDDSDDSSSSLDEEAMAFQVTSFQNQDKPRLSFIPTLMPEMDQSITSPTNVNLYGSHRSMNRFMSPEESYMTPGGGAAVCSFTPNKTKGIQSNAIPNFDPSKLFGIVSEYAEEYPDKQTPFRVRCNNSFAPPPPPPPPQLRRNNEKTKKNKQSPSGLPLYVTHKKRKAKASKHNSLKHSEIKHIKSW